MKTNGLLPPCGEVSQPQYQIGRDTQSDGLLYDNSVIYKIKGPSEVYRSNSYIGVAFVLVDMDEFKEADEVVKCGGEFNVSKLLGVK